MVTRNRFIPVLLAVLISSALGLGAPATSYAAPPAQPVAGAHAHNDYEHDRPLLDALDHGFTSVEADVYLVAGELLVGHDPVDLDPRQTLESLYLAPLEKRVERLGAVYPHWDGTLQLLIDAKTEAVSTYAAIEEALADHPGLTTTTTTRGGRVRVRTGPVEAVISGNRNLAGMRERAVRRSGYDGRLADLDTPAAQLPSSLMPLVSDNWTTSFGWDGTGTVPAEQRTHLHDVVDAAHARGARVRFYETPDAAGRARAAVWRQLLAAGVDHLNTDDLAGLQTFLTRYRAHHPAA